MCLQGSGASHSSRLFREGSMGPDAADLKASRGDFRKVRRTQTSHDEHITFSFNRTVRSPLQTGDVPLSLDTIA